MSKVFLSSFVGLLLLGGGTALAQSDRPALQGAGESQGHKEFRTSDMRQYLQAYAARRKEELANGPRALKDTKADQVSDMERRSRNLGEATRSRITRVLEDHHDELEKLWEGRSVELSAERKERIQNHTQSIASDFERTMQNLTTFTGKLETYIMARSLKETDIVEARAKLESAKNKIAEVQVVYDLVKISLDAIPEAENPGQKVDEARLVFREAEKLTVDARNALRDVLAYMGDHE